jgi:DNA-binding transcriptional ArsR family regulator
MPLGSLDDLLDRVRIRAHPGEPSLAAHIDVPTAATTDAVLDDSVVDETLLLAPPGVRHMSTSDRPATDLESVRERLALLTQETRFSLLQDILGHPSGLPTLKELDHVNPSKSRTTIRQHLQQLVDAGIVEEVHLPEDRRRNDRPYKFYGISDHGRQFLEEHKLLRAADTLREMYDRVEKPDGVERYESAARPER